MNKILIIGQAPAAQLQIVPYDTTMLYEMLSWVGISKEQAQEMFEFEAVCDLFPGYGENGHNKPTLEQMENHWNNSLRDKLWMAQKVIVLGNVAKEYIQSKTTKKTMLFIIHPSRRNYSKIMAKKEELINQLKDFIK